MLRLFLSISFVFQFETVLAAGLTCAQVVSKDLSKIESTLSKSVSRHQMDPDQLKSMINKYLIEVQNDSVLAQGFDFQKQIIEFEKIVYEYRETLLQLAELKKAESHSTLATNFVMARGLRIKKLYSKMHSQNLRLEEIRSEFLNQQKNLQIFIQQLKNSRAQYQALQELLKDYGSDISGLAPQVLSDISSVELIQTTTSTLIISLEKSSREAFARIHDAEQLINEDRQQLLAVGAINASDIYLHMNKRHMAQYFLKKLTPIFKVIDKDDEEKSSEVKDRINATVDELTENFTGQLLIHEVDELLALLEPVLNKQWTWRKKATILMAFQAYVKLTPEQRPVFLKTVSSIQEISRDGFWYFEAGIGGEYAEFWMSNIDRYENGFASIANAIQKDPQFEDALVTLPKIVRKLHNYSYGDPNNDLLSIPRSIPLELVGLNTENLSDYFRGRKQTHELYRHLTLHFAKQTSRVLRQSVPQSKWEDYLSNKDKYLNLMYVSAIYQPKGHPLTEARLEALMEVRTQFFTRSRLTRDFYLYMAKIQSPEWDKIWNSSDAEFIEQIRSAAKQ